MGRKGKKMYWKRIKRSWNVIREERKGKELMIRRKNRKKEERGGEEKKLGEVKKKGKRR